MTLSQEHIGRYVEIETSTRLADGEVIQGTKGGVYGGVRKSQWDDGSLVHWFDNGHINGHKQTCFAFPADDSEGVLVTARVVSVDNA
jgi:hypothetical protein